MNINDALKKDIGLPEVTPHRVRTNKSGTKTGSAETDSVNVQLSKQYQALEAKATDSDSFDAQKVAAIKTAIANGQFQVDPEKVADSLLDTVKNLISSRQT